MQWIVRNNNEDIEADSTDDMLMGSSDWPWLLDLIELPDGEYEEIGFYKNGKPKLKLIYRPNGANLTQDRLIVIGDDVIKADPRKYSKLGLKLIEEA
jgi:hypothetical protein